jgi:hypothetical protein
MAAPHVAGAAAVCLGETGAAGPCAGLSTADVVAKLRADAEDHSTAVAFFGFSGDPLRPVPGAYFGYLPWAGWDTTAPVARSFSPADGATAVPASTGVTVEFSEPMDRPTAQAAFSLRRTSDGAAVAGSFSWSGNRMTFRPSAVLADATGYSAIMGRGALDAAGNHLAGAAGSMFQTGTTVTANPSAATVETGSLRTGSHSALTLDDDVFYEVDSTTTSTRTTSWIAVTGGISNGLSTLQIAYRGRSSIDCKQTISLRNWTKGGWTSLGARTVGPTEVVVDKVVGGTLGDYVSGASGDGELHVRVRCTNSTASFYAGADLLRVTYTR